MSTHNHTRPDRHDQDRRHGCRCHGGQRDRVHVDRTRFDQTRRGADNRQGDSREADSHQGDSRETDSREGDSADSPGDASRGRRAGPDSDVAKSAAPSYPDARTVGAHLVVDKTEWVPGRNPERHLGYDGQRGYAESYLRCIQCGAERQSERAFPSDCHREP